MTATATATERSSRRGAGPSTSRRALPRGPVYLGPAIVLTALLFAYPAVSTLYTSFFDTTGAGSSATFVGFANYIQLFGDPTFWQDLVNTAVFALIFVVGTVGLGALIALALYARIPGHSVWRFVILAPSFLPLAFIGVVWQIGLDPTVGWVTAILKAINPALAQPWLSDQAAVMPVIAVVSVVQGVGWPMAIIWTGLQDIPGEVVEAAVVDGAGPIQRARFVLMPAVRDTVATVTVLQIIFALKVFDMPWVMTGGGPSHSSESLTIFVYTQAFTNLNFGYACAASVVSCILIVGATLGYVVLSRRRGALR
ncbi:carbohydrate ABC transporter permease [Sinomonas sp. P47F7]|uniref:carbohydrate ABC transporter permease n=1 Tax=Sinomonas sp. P47F7 TaxID=3410987 RepID=UPI003BF60FF0